MEDHNNIPPELLNELYALGGFLLSAALAFFRRRYDLKNNYERKEKKN